MYSRDKHLSFTPNAKARRIRRLQLEIPCSDVAKIPLWDLDLVFDQSKRFNELSPADKIWFQRCALEKLLKVLKLFNKHCTPDIKYGLRELDPEEIELECEEEESAQLLMKPKSAGATSRIGTDSKHWDFQTYLYNLWLEKISSQPELYDDAKVSHGFCKCCSRSTEDNTRQRWTKRGKK